MQIALNRCERLGTVLGQQLEPLIKCVHGNAVQRQDGYGYKRQHRIEVEHET
ncbi:hypothetical protein D3C75_1375880 [compost metagenome]